MKKIINFLVVMIMACGVVLAACGKSHSWSTDWSINHTHHWHECLDSHCDEISDMWEHTGQIIDILGGTKITCEVCGYLKIDVDYSNTDVAEFYVYSFNNGGNVTVSYENNSNMNDKRTYKIAGDISYANYFNAGINKTTYEEYYAMSQEKLYFNRFESESDEWLYNNGMRSGSIVGGTALWHDNYSMIDNINNFIQGLAYEDNFVIEFFQDKIVLTVEGKHIFTFTNFGLTELEIPQYIIDNAMPEGNY